MVVGLGVGSGRRRTIEARPADVGTIYGEAARESVCRRSLHGITRTRFELKRLLKMTKLPEIMFRKAALILIPLVSLIIANANAGSAVVVSNNGYYAAAWGQSLNADQAMAKARELCQKKGGTDIKVLLSRNSDPVSGMLFCSIAASGHGPSAIVGAGYGTIPPGADGAAFVDCRQKGGTSPHIVVGWSKSKS